MDDHRREQFAQYAAEAASRHAGPYSNLHVPVEFDNPSREFMAKWILPFYLKGIESFQGPYSIVRHEVDFHLIETLLTYFNWRSRKVGAYFAAIENATEHCQHIGSLLLRSDVCFAGGAYAIALARFNTDESFSYLRKYLDHYLQHPEFDFDQGAVIGALGFLDLENGTDFIKNYVTLWGRFTNHNAELTIKHQVDCISSVMRSVKALAEGAA